MSDTWQKHGLQNTDFRELIVLLAYTKTTQWYSLALAVLKVADTLLLDEKGLCPPSAKKLLELFKLIFEGLVTHPKILCTGGYIQADTPKP